MKIEELLSPLESETIKLLFSSKDLKIRGLSTSFFKHKVLLESTSGKSKVKALFVKPLTDNPSKIIVGLFWTMCFGRNFKVIHWYLVFMILLRTMQKDSESLALVKTLLIATLTSGPSHWQSNMKPIRSSLLRTVGEEHGTVILEKLLKDLPYTLPRKDPKIDSLLKIEIRDYFQSKPKDPRRIGVGYKDQGSLGKDRDELPSSEFIEREAVFESLIRQAKRELPFFIQENVIK